MTKRNLPVVYFQIKKLKEFWTKSNSPMKNDMIIMFDESLAEIVDAHILSLGDQDEE